MTDIYNIGRRVIYKLNLKTPYLTGYKRELDGMCGVIVGVHSISNYHVKFDNFFKGHHDCGGLISYGDGYGYTIDYNFLKFLDEEKDIKIKWYKNGKFID